MEIILNKIEDTLLSMYDELKRVTEIITKREGNEAWLDKRTTKHMLMREDRQLYQYVKDGLLVAKKVGAANVYLASSVYRFLEKNG